VDVERIVDFVNLRLVYYPREHSLCAWYSCDPRSIYRKYKISIRVIRFERIKRLLEFYFERYIVVQYLIPYCC
jgi:hypothetical protein